MRARHVVPSGEERLHWNDDECSCQPTRRIYQGDIYIIHHAFDYREIWLGVERMLAITCSEHGEFVERDKYLKAVALEQEHEHIPRPKPHFEYDHQKIDPRL